MKKRYVFSGCYNFKHYVSSEIFQATKAGLQSLLEVFVKTIELISFKSFWEQKMSYRVQNILKIYEKLVYKFF